MRHVRPINSLKKAISVSGMTNGWVVLCDVRASKRLEGRERLRERQKALFDELYERHADTLLFPWVAIEGVDEFGCVARNDAWRAMLASLWMVLHPVVFRTAAVYGPVATWAVSVICVMRTEQPFMRPAVG